MARNAWMASMTCAFVLVAPAAISANNALSDFDDDLSAYGEPRTAGHGQYWQPQHESGLALVLAARPASVPAQQSVANLHPPAPGKAPFIRRDRVDELTYRSSGVELRLPNGNVVTFLVQVDEEGKSTPWGVTELRRAGNRGFAYVPALIKATPPQIFHALTQPGTVVPAFLRLDKVEFARSLPQGWARDLVLSGGIEGGGVGTPELICPEIGWNWNDFRNEVLSKGFLWSFLSEGDGPETKPAHWRKAEGTDQFKLLGGADNVSSFFGAVLYCFPDPDEDAESSDPRVIWRVSRSGQSGTQITDSEHEFLETQGEQYTFLFSAPEPPNATGDDFGIELRIEFPHGGDKFYIGATWSKISDTLIVP